MTSRKPKAKELLDRFLKDFGNPPEEAMESFRAQVLEQFKSDASFVPEMPAFESRDATPYQDTGSRRLLIAIAAVLSVVLALSAVFLHMPSNASRVEATVEAADDGLSLTSGNMVRSLRIKDAIKAGENLRSQAGAVLVLTDGSRVEMRAQTELALEPSDDGVRIQLNKGGVIVNAAKQRAGHLYVRTKDLTVSVVGTVFLVNAEEEGSRVAVIQGEVQVQQGTLSKKLLPGEQVATNSAMPSLPVIDEISWSRNVLAHVALLERAAEPQVAPPLPTPRAEFAVVSIKLVEPGTPYPGPIGIGCRGADAVHRMITALLVGFDTDLNVPQGRCVARGANVSALVSFAYGNPRSVTGGPDWIQPRNRVRSGDNVITFMDARVFQIEAEADNPATATLDQLKQMFQTMLADRFKLKVHRQMGEAPGFSLVVGKNGPKLKAASGPEEVPAQIFDDKGRIVLRGKSTLDKLARSLVAVRAPVVDKTGLSGIYEYEIVAPRPLPPGQLPPGAAGPPAADGRGGGGGFPQHMAGLWSAALEEQLGLRLQLEKSLPVEVVVIDQVEKPTEN